jgi:hypothetical protein
VGENRVPTRRGPGDGVEEIKSSVMAALLLDAAQPVVADYPAPELAMGEVARTQKLPFFSRDCGRMHGRTINVRNVRLFQSDAIDGRRRPFS